MTASRGPRVGLPPVIPPTDLKRRVLDAARAAAAAGQTVTAPPVGRLKLWDLAWIAALVMLVAGHVWLSLPRPPVDWAAQAPPPLAEPSTEPKLEGPIGDVVANQGSGPSESDRAQTRELMRQI